MSRAESRSWLFGVPVDPLTMDETVERCVELIEGGRTAQHVVLNAAKVVMLDDVPGLRDVIASCEVVNADGQSVVWAGRLLGVAMPERVAGIDLMGRLLQRAETAGYPVFFLGATAEVLERFDAEVRRRHPRIIVVGKADGFFEDEESIAESIAASGARILFVGMPSPGKEFLLDGWRSHLAGVFMMGVGGSFDVWAGQTRRAPVWMQRAGLEWLFRLAQEPGRMWRRYFVGNARFVYLVAGEAIDPARGRKDTRLP